MVSCHLGLRRHNKYRLINEQQITFSFNYCAKNKIKGKFMLFEIHFPKSEQGKMKKLLIIIENVMK